MGDTIWRTLTEYEGRWVAVDRLGKVVAHSDSLSGVMKSAGEDARRLTFLYAAPEPAPLPGVRS
jgi:hypothetical protein